LAQAQPLTGERFSVNSLANAIERGNKVESSILLRKVTPMNQSIGQRFPDIELPDQDGEAVKLSQLVGKFPFILSFYRGYW
jgi:hypothetical protein